MLEPLLVKQVLLRLLLPETGSRLLYCVFHIYVLYSRVNDFGPPNILGHLLLVLLLPGVEAMILCSVINMSWAAE